MGTGCKLRTTGYWAKCFLSQSKEFPLFLLLHISGAFHCNKAIQKWNEKLRIKLKPRWHWNWKSKVRVLFNFSLFLCNFQNFGTSTSFLLLHKICNALLCLCYGLKISIPFDWMENISALILSAWWYCLIIFA